MGEPLDPQFEGRLNEGLAALRDRRPGDAIALLEPTLADALEANANEPEMLARGLLAPALFEIGRMDEAIEHAERALALATALQDDTGMEHYSALVVDFGKLKRRREEAQQEAAERLRRTEEALDAAADGLTDGRPDVAIARLEPIVAETRSHGLLTSEASARGMLAQALAMDFRPDEALPHAERAYEIAQQLGDDRVAQHFEELVDTLRAPAETDPMALARRSAQIERLCRQAGEHMDNSRSDEAIALLEQAIVHAADGQVPGPEATAQGMLAQARLGQGDRDAAERAARRALEIATDLDDQVAIDGFCELLERIAAWTAAPGDA